MSVAPAVPAEGAAPTQTAPDPSPPSAPDVATAPLSEVRQYLRSRPEAAPADTPAAPESAAADASQAAAKPGSPEPADPAATEPAATPPPAKEEKGQRAAPSADVDPALLKRQNDSLAGNLRQLQQQRQQDQQALQQAIAQVAALNNQIAAMQESQQRSSFERDIANLPPEIRQQALQEYEGRRRDDQRHKQLDEFSGYLNQTKTEQDAREQQLSYRQREIDLADQRAALPAMFDAYAPFLAERYNVDSDWMLRVVRSDAVKNAIARYNDESHAILIGETLASIAQVEGERLAEQRKANGQAAQAAGVHRAEAGVGTGGGQSEVERIRGMTAEQFREHRQNLRRGAAQMVVR